MQDGNFIQAQLTAKHNILITVGTETLIKWNLPCNIGMHHHIGHRQRGIGAILTCLQRMLLRCRLFIAITQARESGLDIQQTTIHNLYLWMQAHCLHVSLQKIVGSGHQITIQEQQPRITRFTSQLVTDCCSPYVFSVYYMTAQNILASLGIRQQNLLICRTILHHHYLYRNPLLLQWLGHNTQAFHLHRAIAVVAREQYGQPKGRFHGIYDLRRERDSNP